MRYVTSLARAAALAILVTGCSSDGSSPTTPTTPTTPVATNTITISSAGVVSPNSIQVAVGSKVTIVNNDTRIHDMDSNPHPVHTDCPQINWGAIQPGQAKESEALSTARTCGFHDHGQPTNSSLQGTILIQ
jgi:hypothetical protein